MMIIIIIRRRRIVDADIVHVQSQKGLMML